MKPPIIQPVCSTEFQQPLFLSNGKYYPSQDDQWGFSTRYAVYRERDQLILVYEAADGSVLTETPLPEGLFYRHEYGQPWRKLE